MSDIAARGYAQPDVLVSTDWVAEHLNAGETLMLLGDLNDGPGLDEYEELFGRSSVEIIRGEDHVEPRLVDPNASLALQRRLGAQPTSARSS